MRTPTEVKESIKESKKAIKQAELNLIFLEGELYESQRMIPQVQDIMERLIEKAKTHENIKKVISIECGSFVCVLNDRTSETSPYKYFLQEIDAEDEIVVNVRKSMTNNWYEAKRLEVDLTKKTIDAIWKEMEN